MRDKNLFLTYFIGCIGLIEAVLAGYIFYFNYMCMDHAEHLHAAWLVWQGKVPYRDFFEHHNPLLWYVLAPIVAGFYRNALILYVARVISFLAYSVFFIGFYKICRRFLKVRVQAVILAVLFYFLVPDNMFMVFELQPDSFMWAAGIWGLYWLMAFVETKNQRALFIAFLLFLIAFMFLQKIAVFLLLWGGWLLYLCIWKKNCTLGTLLKAAAPSVGLLAGWLLWLHYTNSFNLYFLFNYDLNFWMQAFMGAGKILKDWRVTAILPGCAVLVLRRFLASKNCYREAITGVMYADYAIKLLTGAPYCQYFIFNNLIGALILADYVVENILKKWVKIGALSFFVLILPLYYSNPPNDRFPRYFVVQDYIMKNMRDHEKILNSVMHFFNIYGDNPSYYWFGHGNIAMVAHYLYGYEEAFDVNRILKEEGPMFFYGVAYPNMMLFSNVGLMHEYRKSLEKIFEKLSRRDLTKEEFVDRWMEAYFYVPDVAFLEQYYVMTPYPPLMVRKDFAVYDKMKAKQ